MPIMNLAVALLILGSTLMWAVRAKGRGAFSALLALVAVIAGGAVAFSFWESLSLFFLSDSTPELLQPFAHTLGLLLPFALATIVFRLVLDLIARSNLMFNDIVNFIGGGVFGLGIGVISAGFLALGLSYMPGGKDGVVIGYNAVERDGSTKAMVRQGSLWIPVDDLTEQFYGFLSAGSFAGTDMAVHRPGLVEQAATMRRGMFVRVENSAHISKHYISPDHMSLLSSFTIPGTFSPDELMADTSTPIDNQKTPSPGLMTYPWGEKPKMGDPLYGYVLNFNSLANEPRGQFVITPAQARLVAINANETESVAVHPFSIISTAEGEGEIDDFVRFLARSGDEPVPSVSGGQEVTYGFEFLVPQGYSPRYLLVKGARIDLQGAQPQVIASPKERDVLVDENQLAGLAGATGFEINEKLATRVANDELSISTRPQLGRDYAVNTQNMKTLELDKDNMIVNGEQLFSQGDLLQSSASRKLSIQGFAAIRNTKVIQVTISEKGNRTALGDRLIKGVSDSGVGLMLYDKESKKGYLPMGYLDDPGQGTFTIRYTPNQQISTIAELELPTRNDRNKTLRLVYRVPHGVTITHVTFGDVAIFELEDAIEVN